MSQALFWLHFFFKFFKIFFSQYTQDVIISAYNQHFLRYNEIIYILGGFLGTQSLNWGSFSTLAHLNSFCCCSFIHMYIHCLGHFSPLPPSLTLPPLRTSVPGRSRSALLLTDFVEERHKHNKEDKVFLLVMLRLYRKIPTITPMYPCVTTMLIQFQLIFTLVPDPPLMITSVALRFLYYFLWSADIKHFHVLGFLPISISPVCALPCLVIQVQPHCCICPRSKFHI
jgi:hypothetical protein